MIETFSVAPVVIFIHLSKRNPKNTEKMEDQTPRRVRGERCNSYSVGYRKDVLGA